MAETSKGKKFVKVKGYTRVVDGKKVRVGAFDRSTPGTSKGQNSGGQGARTLRRRCEVTGTRATKPWMAGTESPAMTRHSS